MTTTLEQATARFVRLAKEAEAHQKQYYPEGLRSMEDFKMVYADALDAEREMLALRSAA